MAVEQMHEQMGGKIGCLRQTHATGSLCDLGPVGYLTFLFYFLNLKNIYYKLFLRK